MPNYQETNISGTKWRRARGVYIENPYGGIPRLSFQEEDVLNIDSSPIIQGLPPQFKMLTAEFDPSAVIILLDPSTGLPSGSTMTHQDLYIALNSLYMQLANVRDNPPPAVVQPTVPTGPQAAVQPTVLPTPINPNMGIA